MDSYLQFDYRFHPVGQGLFCSGTLDTLSVKKNPFNWVFDCGSMASEEEIEPQISNYRDFVLCKSQINLLCVSHFDKDHVSGLARLLKDTHVDTVVIPYFTPLERLILGTMQENASDTERAENSRLMANPAAYIIQHAASVKTIIMVHREPPPDSTNGSPPLNTHPDSPLRNIIDQALSDGGLPGDRSNRTNDAQWNMKIREPEVTVKESRFADGIKKSLGNWKGKLHFVGEACKLDVLSPAHCLYWEFVFFHKPEAPATVQALVTSIEDIVKGETQSTTPLGISDCLQNKRIRNKIKKAYHAAFPETDRFNTAGLSVYSGPILHSLEYACITIPQPWHRIPPITGFSNWHNQYLPYPFVYDNHSVAALYTGDANFKPDENRAEIIKYLDTERWRSIRILQVPHHGSKNNWKVGSANEFCNHWSVFSSDPDQKPYHPSRDVILDLLNKNPVMVDQHSGASWMGICHFETNKGVS